MSKAEEVHGRTRMRDRHHLAHVAILVRIGMLADPDLIGAVGHSMNRGNSGCVVADALVVPVGLDDVADRDLAEGRYALEFLDLRVRLKNPRAQMC
jgi:hypothetical protein